MKIQFLFFILSIFIACNKSENKHPQSETDSKIESFNSKKLEKSNPKDSVYYELQKAEVMNEKDSVYYELQKAEVMNEKDILFNGKLTRYFNITEFENTFGKPDSLVLMSKEEPCNYEFENEDGSKDLDDKYIYKDGSRFENSKNKVAVDEFRFTNNNFINYRGIIMNSKTTKNDLKKYFPYAIENIGILDVYKEGELEVIKLREDAENNLEGHLKIFFKNGKLYFMHWWFPC